MLWTWTMLCKAVIKSSPRWNLKLARYEASKTPTRPEQHETLNPWQWRANRFGSHCTRTSPHPPTPHPTQRQRSHNPEMMPTRLWLLCRAAGSSYQTRCIIFYNLQSLISQWTHPQRHSWRTLTALTVLLYNATFFFRNSPSCPHLSSSSFWNMWKHVESRTEEETFDGTHRCSLL